MFVSPRESCEHSATSNADVFAGFVTTHELGFIDCEGNFQPTATLGSQPALRGIYRGNRSDNGGLYTLNFYVAFSNFWFNPYDVKPSGARHKPCNLT